MKYFIISPAALIIFPWCIVLLLYSLHLTDNLVPLPLGLMALLILMFFIFIFISFFSYYPFQETIINDDSNFIDVDKLISLIKIQLLIWGLGTIFEIYYSGGLPIFWSMMGDARNYTDFGLPSFHGLMNAFYFSLASSLFLIYKLTNCLRYLIFVVFLAFWPILMLGCGIILTLIVQVFVIDLFYSGVNLRKILYMCIFAIAVILGFGFIGDIRGSVNPFMGLIVNEHIAIFDILPSGFLWIMYI